LNILYFTVNLNGTAPTTISGSILTGAFTVEVTAIVSNGPCATFQISKNSTGSFPSIMRLTSSAGALSNERLLISWPPNSSIQISKTGVNYNGQFQLKIS
jgi:hypothetical protein